MAVIDAKNQILGRLCTHVAKRLLDGEEITIVNAEDVRVSGSRTQLVKHYKQRRARGKNFSGPKYPRSPDMILKRSVRGMLDYRKTSGREAYKRLKVYVGMPRELKDIATESPEASRKIVAKSVCLGDIARELGSGRL
ncbi:MAG: 50S ribosomal protein L13 [Methanobacteriota archaeon]|nr:MAG: 50S ribosomal protein L13 [Euryarchaeota archaeon]